MRVMFLAPLIAGLFSVPTYAGNIEKHDDGTYQQQIELDSGHFQYIADRLTEQCFISRSGITEISCSKLAKRPEWRNVLTWVKKIDD